MYRSTSYASQGSKTAFVEIAQRSAATAQLLQDARVAKPGRRPKSAGAVARGAVDHLLASLRGTRTRVGIEARG